MSTFQKHLATLHTTEGTSLAYEFKGRFSIGDFTRAIRGMNRRQQEAGKAAYSYSYLWFSTEDGFMFYAVGEDRFVTDLETFVQGYTGVRKTQHKRIYKGGNKDLLMVRIANDLPNFKQIKGRRSFGGRP